MESKNGSWQWQPPVPCMHSKWLLNMSSVSMSARNRPPVQACSRFQQATNASVHGNISSQLHTSSVSTNHVRFAKLLRQPRSCLAMHAQEHTSTAQQGFMTIFR